MPKFQLNNLLCIFRIIYDPFIMKYENRTCSNLFYYILHQKLNFEFNSKKYEYNYYNCHHLYTHYSNISITRKNTNLSLITKQ